MSSTKSKLVLGLHSSQWEYRLFYNQFLILSLLFLFVKKFTCESSFMNSVVKDSRSTTKFSFSGFGRLSHSLFKPAVAFTTGEYQFSHCTKKWSLPLRISSVNIAKSAVSSAFCVVWYLLSAFLTTLVKYHHKRSPCSTYGYILYHSFVGKAIFHLTFYAVKFF